jgi:para-nitrobenzyl esterase
MSRCVLVAALVLAGGVAYSAPSLEVKTAQGRIVGEAAADGIRVYRGIPYAAPPVGDLRWRNPQPPARWSGVRDATKFGPRCMQSSGSAGGRIREAVANQPISEDCLYLNIWTAAQRARERRPVVVWIHGGSFIIGTGSQHDGTTLAKRGAVLVSINYRLNAFGFLAHPALSAESPQRSSGNYGFADTIAALEWVRKNIAAFGGDPEQVTVMGQSAGGRLIQSLRTSSCARGLFRRAIIHSAPVRILPMRALDEVERGGGEAAGKLGAKSLPELRALAAQRVLEDLPAGQPIIDGHCIVEDSLRAAATGNSHDVDLLVGSNADEGTFPYLRARDFGVGFSSAAEFSEYAHRRFGDGVNAFLETYGAASEAGFSAAQLAAFRDEVAWTARFTALSHARRGRTFLYFFSHRPPTPATGPDRGATHGAEIVFAYGTPAPNWRDEDRRVADVMSAYWANFAIRGDPNGPGLPAWPEFKPENGQRMNLGPMSPEPALDSRRIAVFDELYRRVFGDASGGRE